MRIGITVTAFNRREFTEQCLLSILWSKPQETAVCLVDNGSTDGTRELLLEYYNKHDIFKHIIFNKDNLYVGRAINQGWGLLASNCDAVMAINNDFLLAPGWDNNVRACMEELNIDWLIGSVRPSWAQYSKKTLTGKGTYTNFRGMGAAICLRSKHFINGIRPSSELWGRPGYVGHGSSWYKKLKESFPDQEVIRLASPGIVVRNSEYIKPEYVEYYNQTFNTRGRENQLARFRALDKAGKPRGWMDWKEFLKRYHLREWRLSILRRQF